MIQQRKSQPPPASLASGKRYDGEDVKKLLFEDHLGKCYLCESETEQNFVIEHLRSKNNYPELTCDWNNLFLACPYCNGKKLDLRDDILHPCEEPLELLIDICPDFMSPSRHVEIRPLSEESKALQGTVELLDSIHNGVKPGMRTTRENVFYQRLREHLLDFQSCVLNYQHAANEENRRAVAERLQISQPFLAAKISILRKSPELLNEFAEETLWNR